MDLKSKLAEIQNTLDDECMLPSTAEESFEIYRRVLAEQAVEHISPEQWGWFARELRDTVLEGKNLGCAEIFMPLMEPRAALSQTAYVAILPPTTFTVCRGLPMVAELQAIAIGALESLGRRLRNYDDSEIHQLADVARATLADELELHDRHTATEYIAVNASIRVRDFLTTRPALWQRFPVRRVFFPDMLAVRRKQLKEHPLFVPPLTDDEINVCFRDEDLLQILPDTRLFVLHPNIRHLVICRRCAERLMQLAKQRREEDDIPLLELRGAFDA